MKLACRTISPAADKLEVSKSDTADQQQSQHAIHDRKQTCWHHWSRSDAAASSKLGNPDQLHTAWAGCQQLAGFEIAEDFKSFMHECKACSGSGTDVDKQALHAQTTGQGTDLWPPLASLRVSWKWPK